MKKLFILGAFLLTGSMAFAQLDQGTMRLGLDLGFSSTSNDANDDKSSSFNVGPDFGYFIADNLEVMAGIDFMSGTDEVATVEFKNSGMNINLGIRKYFAVADDFAPWAAFGIGIGSGKSEIDGTSVAEMSSLMLGVTLGATYFVSDNIGITASLGGLSYAMYTDKAIGGGEDYKESAIALDLTKRVSFGVSYYFY